MMNDSVLPFEFPWCERYLCVFDGCVQWYTSSDIQLMIYYALYCGTNFCEVDILCMFR